MDSRRSDIVTGPILVTGASGFIGRHLCRVLAERGDEVVALLRRDSDCPPQATPLRVDANSDVAEVVENLSPSRCYHLATHFSVADDDPAEIDRLVEANLGLTAHLAAGLARVPDTSLVAVGTVWQHVYSEAFRPNSLYAATKQAALDILVHYTMNRGLRMSWVELGDTYGPDDPRPKLIPTLLRIAGTEEEIMLSPGEQLVDPLFVDDAVAGLIAAAGSLSAAEMPTPMACLADSPVTLRQLVALVTEVIGVEPNVRWGARPYRPVEMFEPWRAGDRPPGWEPTTSLRDGLQKLASTVCA